MALFDALERGLYFLGHFVVGGDADPLVQLSAPYAIDTSRASLPDQKPAPAPAGESLRTGGVVDGWVTTSDGLVSGILLKGARRLMGADEYRTAIKHLEDLLRPYLGGDGKHSIGFAFRSSPASAKDLVEAIYASQRATGRRLGMADEPLIDAQVQAISAQAVEESVYMVIGTNAAGLTPAERKRHQAERQAAAKRLAALEEGARLDQFSSQQPRVPPSAIVPRHAAVVQTILARLEAELNEGGLGLNATLLSAGELAALMRRYVDAAAPASWRPQLLGETGKQLPSVPSRKRSQSHLFPIRIGRQLFPATTTELFGNAELATNSGVTYASLVVEMPCRNGIAPFNDLAQLVGRDVPYTCTIDILDGGNKIRGVDRFFLSFVGAMSDYNKRIRLAWRELTEAKYKPVAVRIVLTTWASSARNCEEQVVRLRSRLEQWGGGCLVTNETGAPAHIRLGAAAGLASALPAPLMPGPLEEWVKLLPLFRADSVWDTGQLVLRTDEGRPYPIAFGSPMQAYWGCAIFAPTGTGKSFLMNMCNAGVLLSPGLEDLPLITMVDVGPSAKLVHDYIRGRLPPAKRNQVLYFRVRNDPAYAVNVLDTQLGCDQPTQIDRDFIITVVTAIAPGLGAEGEKFVGQVIDKTYQIYGRKSPRQRRWQEALDPELQAQALRAGIDISGDMFVWQLVDEFFSRGLIESAVRAQRYAMPKMDDLSMACAEAEIKDNWSEVTTPTGEPLIAAFRRAITTGAADYSMVYGYTKFDVGNARAVFIDLEELVGGDESESGKRRAAMAFLMGRRMGAKNYFLRWDELKSIVAEPYLAYQLDRVNRINEELKFLEYDEVHFAASIEAMRRRLEQDLRVGRKYKIVTSMASQQLSDFTQAMIDNCYSFFVLGTGSDNSVDEIQKTFALSASERVALEKVYGRGRLLAIFKTVKGRTSQVLNAVASPYMQWAFNSDRDDALVRAALTEHFDGDYARALAALTQVFPSGSCRTALDTYRKSKTDDRDGATITGGFLAKLVLPLLNELNDSRQAA